MVGIIRREPVGDLMDDFFRGFFVKPMGYERTEPARGMRLDVTEQADAYTVHADLPGAKKEDIEVKIDGDTVSIATEIRAQRDIKDGAAKDGERVVHTERYYGKLARSFSLGQDIDPARAEAKFSDGVLALTLPKKATASTRQIAIQ
ncbi:MAG: Hsp20/alpha crystallin family protein [Burkholderiales bacterium]